MGRRVGSVHLDGKRGGIAGGVAEIERKSVAGDGIGPGGPKTAPSGNASWGQRACKRQREEGGSGAARDGATTGECSRASRERIQPAEHTKRKQRRRWLFSFWERGMPASRASPCAPCGRGRDSGCSPCSSSRTAA